jgi:hypothetical protein
MSKNDKIDLRQDRRQWLKTSATVLGASLLPLPAISSEAPQTPAAPEVKALESKSAGHFFAPREHRMVEELSETIIPADSRSGGARAAKVADFIDQFVRERQDETHKALWREGLPLIESMSQHYNGKSFVDATPEERISILTILSTNGPNDDDDTRLPEVRLYHELKRLTVLGYYTSKIGIHDELEYKGNRILMEFVGCDDPTPPTT